MVGRTDTELSKKLNELLARNMTATRDGVEKPHTLDKLIARLETVAGNTTWTPTRIEVPLNLIRDALAALRIARGDK